MNLEKIALIGIAVFAFMALAAIFTTMSTIKRIAGRPTARTRHRLVRGPESARMVALSLVGEVARRKSEEAELSRQQGKLTEDLQNALEQAENYFLERVDARHIDFFYKAIDELILKKQREGT